MEKGVKTLDNLKIYKKENYVSASVNPKIYPLSVVYSAAYILIDKAYAVIEGDPEEKIEVLLRPKEEYDLEKLGREFNTELLNYAVYMVQQSRNKEVRDAMVKKALATAESASEESNRPWEDEED